MKKRPGIAILLAVVLCLGLALSAWAADGKAPLCASTAVTAALAVPTPDSTPALPELSAPAPADPFGGFTPAPQLDACPPLANGCCIVYKPGYPCPMCNDFDCEEP